RATDPCGRCDRSTGPAARQRPSLFLGRQRLGELAQVSGKDAGEVASRVVDAVIGDPRLREVVGPDALRALTGADLHQARLAGLALSLLPFALEQPCPQDGESFLLVLDLRLAVLARHDDL